jgi:hypothetical protein
LPYFLDGNNLVGAARRTSRPSEEDRAALVREVCDRLRRTRARAVLFFDGPSPGGASDLGTVSLRYSGAGSADDRIVAEIARSRSPGEITVVTEDRALARRARDAGARAAAPADFWRRFGTAEAAPGKAAEGEAGSMDVEEWMRYFEDEGNRR